MLMCSCKFLRFYPWIVEPLHMLNVGSVDLSHAYLSYKNPPRPVNEHNWPVVKIEALIWVSFWRALKFFSFTWQVGSNPRHQSKNVEMQYKTHIKLVYDLYIWYMFSIQCEELTCQVHLTPRLVVTMPYACWFLWQVDYAEDFKWCLHFQFGVAFWRALLRAVNFEAPNRVWRALKTSILNTAIGARRLGVEWFVCGPKMANSKSGGPKRTQWLARYRCCFTPRVITLGCHPINRFVCIRMQSRIIWCSS